METGPGGSIHILFLDATNFWLGASSSMVLDRFIDDPDEGNEALLVRLGTGVFRIISGKLRKTAFRVETPVATIGIRGTDFEVTVANDGSTTVSVNQGTVEVSVNAGVSDFAPLSEAVRAGLSIAVSAGTGQTTLGRASPSADPGLRGPPGARERERAEERSEQGRARLEARSDSERDRAAARAEKELARTEARSQKGRASAHRGQGTQQNAALDPDQSPDDQAGGGSEGSGSGGDADSGNGGGGGSGSGNGGGGGSGGGGGGGNGNGGGQGGGNGNGGGNGGGQGGGR